jgi:hypothetical protein
MHLWMPDNTPACKKITIENVRCHTYIVLLGESIITFRDENWKIILVTQASFVDIIEMFCVGVLKDEGYEYKTQNHRKGQQGKTKSDKANNYENLRGDTINAFHTFQSHRSHIGHIDRRGLFFRYFFSRTINKSICQQGKIS